MASQACGELGSDPFQGFFRRYPSRLIGEGVLLRQRLVLDEGGHLGQGFFPGSHDGWGPVPKGPPQVHGVFAFLVEDGSFGKGRGGKLEGSGRGGGGKAQGEGNPEVSMGGGMAWACSERVAAQARMASAAAEAEEPEGSGAILDHPAGKGRAAKGSTRFPAWKVRPDEATT